MLALGLASCGPTHLATGPTVPTVVQVAHDTERDVVALTDAETVLDVMETDGRVWVATNLGLFGYSKSGGAVQKADWLPDGPVHAVFRSQNGTELAALGDVLWSRTAYRDVKSVSLGATIVDLAEAPQGGFVACTERGVLRTKDNPTQGWLAGELDLHSCDALYLQAEDLWVVGDRGRSLLRLSGDTAREHGQAIAELSPGEEVLVTSLAPLTNGEALALLSTGNRAQLALYRDGVWVSYTSLPFDGEVLGLAATNSAHQAWLVTTGGHFIIDVAAEGEGAAAVPVAVGKPDRVLAWKPRWLPPGVAAVERAHAEHLAVASTDTPRRFVDAPSEPPEAPELRFLLLERPSPTGTPTVHTAQSGVFLAPPHQGLVRIQRSEKGQHYRTRSLVPETGSPYRLSLAHQGERAMLVGANAEILVFENGVFSPLRAPEGVRVQSLASRGDRLIAAGLNPQRETAFDIYELRGETFELTRTVESGTRLASITRLGLSTEGDIWVALRVLTEEGTDVPRGVLWLPADGREPVAFHRAIEVIEGAVSKPAPDNVFDLDLGQGGFAWLATFSGAVRIGDDQVVVFGQARGVPGESVYDVRASDERMWLMAAGAPGTYDNRDLDFKLPEVARTTKATRVATHAGQVWLAGPGGVARFDGRDWHNVKLPKEHSGETIDVDIDQSGRVWLLLEDELLLIDPTQQ